MTRQQLYPGVIGMQVNAPTNPREGLVDDGLIAHSERVEEARRYWPEASASDFEMLDRRGVGGKIGRRVPCTGVSTAAPDTVALGRGGRYVLRPGRDAHIPDQRRAPENDGDDRPR
jgi:hypothetical protein